MRRRPGNRGRAAGVQAPMELPVLSMAGLVLIAGTQLGCPAHGGAAARPSLPDAGAPTVTRPTLPPAAYVRERDRVLAEAHAVLALLAIGDADGVFGRFSPALGEEVPRAKVGQLVDALVGVGGITAVAHERAVPLSDRVRTYVADVTIQEVPQALSMAFDAGWQLVGLQFGRPPEPPPPGPGAAVALPFPADGPWLVFWGGDDPRDNYHVIAADQRHAYDLVVWADGSTFRGDGTRNEDYRCFGTPIVAPLDARVVAVVSDLPDNVPGTMDAAHPAGNHVLLEVGADRFLMLAHLQAGSVVLREGDQVRRGAMIGRCGNSGNSSEAHLHVHLQDRPTFGDPEAHGLPLQFKDVVVDGATLPTAAPIRGRFVQRATPF